MVQLLKVAADGLPIGQVRILGQRVTQVLFGRPDLSGTEGGDRQNECEEEQSCAHEHAAILEDRRSAAQLQTQVLGQDLILGEHTRTPQDILQFAHIARPALRFQHLQGGE